MRQHGQRCQARVTNCSGRVACAGKRHLGTAASIHAEQTVSTANSTRVNNQARCTTEVRALASESCVKLVS